jgi:hypothetical protein
MCQIAEPRLPVQWRPAVSLRFERASRNRIPPEHAYFGHESHALDSRPAAS